ncbi:MAG: type II secretion system F family protein [Acidobacteriaceae bacterium]
MFVFVLLVAFAFLMLLTRPTKEETTVNARLSSIKRDMGQGIASQIDILRRDTYSDVPWMNAVISKLAIAARARRLIAQAGRNWTVGRLVASSLLGPVLVIWFGRIWISNSIVLALISIALFCAPLTYLYFVRAARLRHFNMLLPEAMDLISRALKAGHSITSAIEMVALEIGDPVGPEFRRLFEEQNFGLPVREAFLNLIDRVPVDDLRFLVTAILIQRETGGNLIEVLDKTTAVLRDRIRLQGQLRVYTAQGRLTGWILCVLPFLAFAVLSLLNPKYISVLLSDSLGQHLVWIGLGLMAFGIWVISKIVDVKV